MIVWFGGVPSCAGIRYTPRRSIAASLRYCACLLRSPVRYQHRAQDDRTGSFLSSTPSTKVATMFAVLYRWKNKPGADPGAGEGRLDADSLRLVPFFRHVELSDPALDVGSIELKAIHREDSGDIATLSFRTA